jgi:putative nucleotidyltransferase with HDIG domain
VSATSKYDGLLDEVLEIEGVAPGHQGDIRVYLRILRNRDEATYEHSVRVGILASKIAVYAAKPGVTAKMMLWAGLLHDIGKALVPPGVLTKKESFTREDYEAMEPHVRYGWDMLNGVHDYTAHILVRHHRFGSNPYPKELPPVPEWVSSHTGGLVVVSTAARLLALADYYDALMSRDNERNGKSLLTPAQKRETYFRDNADQKELIELLESVGVIRFN